MATNNPNIPVVRDGLAYKHDGGPVVCRVAAPERPQTGWVDWLNRTKSFHFDGFAGSMTCTAEIRNRGRGARYWYAWRSLGGRRKKMYIGKSETLTIERLEAVAGKLSQLKLVTEE